MPLMMTMCGATFAPMTPGHQTEVRGEPVVESVHHAAEVSARPAGVPRLADAAHHRRQLACVHGRVRRDVDCRRVGQPVGRLPRQPEVGLHLAPFFSEEKRQNQ